jgi:hypothetical protein
MTKKSEAEGTFDRRKCRWNVNVNVDFQELACVGVSWFQLCQDRVQLQICVTCPCIFCYQCKVGKLLPSFVSDFHEECLQN